MFKNVGTITEILQLLDDEAILILRHITSEVADWIDRILDILCQVSKQVYIAC